MVRKLGKVLCCMFVFAFLRVDFAQTWQKLIRKVITGAHTGGSAFVEDTLKQNTFSFTIFVLL